MHTQTKIDDSDYETKYFTQLVDHFNYRTLDQNDNPLYVNSFLWTSNFSLFFFYLYLMEHLLVFYLIFSRTYQQRYLYNDKHWGNNPKFSSKNCQGPILFYTGNESPVTDYYPVCTYQWGWLLCFWGINLTI
jgi:hypothetical protein